MKKDAYFFSHDTNARRDPKILAVRSQYGAEGYAWYFMIIEILAEQKNYRMKLDKLGINAIAMELLCDTNTVEDFVNTCISDYELFNTDGEYFWSESLFRRMEIKDEIKKRRSQAGKAGAQARWGKKKEQEKQSDSKRMANAYESNAIYSKQNETKLNETKLNDKKESRSKYKFETHHMGLAELLFKKMKQNNPKAKDPNYEEWANTFRLMMERDNREGKEIQKLILWTQSHHFWYKNILSADKLRKQYDRLLLEMKEDESKLKVISGGGKNEKSQGSYEQDSTTYDFSKRRGL